MRQLHTPISAQMTIFQQIHTQNFINIVNHFIIEF